MSIFHSRRVFSLIVISSLFIFASNVITTLSSPGVDTELLFNEGTGTTTADGSGNAHTGTLLNGPLWVSGKYGQAISFDGTNDYVNLADQTTFTLDPAGSYTWSAWIKNSSFKQWSTVWSQTINTQNFFYFYAHTTTDPDGGPVTNGISVYWWVNNGASKLGVHSTNNVLTTGQWSYVTVTYDGTKAQNSRFSIYVNGADVTDRTDIASVGTVTTIDPTNIRIGSNQPFGEYYTGSIDEVRFYRRLLTTTEIATDMNTGGTPDLQAPAVSITAPASGSIITGTTTVTANASDNVAVAGVQFLLDGVNLGAEVITSPYSVSWNSSTATSGTHSITARARDAAGNTTTSSGVSVTVNMDNIAPTVSISAPSGGSVVSGTTTVSANASDNVGVVGVQFILDGANLGAEVITAPYNISWNSLTAVNGMHSLSAKARDASGNSTVSATIPVNVSNSSLVAAYGFNENTGTSTADQSGNGNAASFTNSPTWSTSGKFGSAISFNGSNAYLKVNDANILDLTSGMTLEAWVNPTSLSSYRTVISKENGTTNLAYALSANNSTTSSSNQRPDSRIRIGTTTKTATGTAKLAANTWTHLASTYDGANLRLYVNGSLVSTLAVTGAITVTANQLCIGGSPALGGQYFPGLIDEVRIYNRALSSAEISTDMVTPIGTDLTAPSVSITAPLANSTISGTVPVTANATDNVGIAGVQFLLDGTSLGSEVTALPYSVNWNSITVSNGSHILTARARDAAGNITTSAQVTVTTNNDKTAPAVNITSPTDGATISGTIPVTANATDNIAVIGVQFLLDGVNLGTEVTTAPYSISWNTATATNGAHILTVRARDAAGNTTISSPINVTVNGDITPPTVNITSPADGATIVGTITVTANASDNIAVVGVQFLLDGVNLGTELTASPYSTSWNTATAANGAHVLTARTRDLAGNTATATSVGVTVNNPVSNVSISGVSSGSTTDGSTVINWTTSGPSTSQVKYGLTTTYDLSTLVDPRLIISHSQTILSLEPGKTYHYAVVSIGADGVLVTSPDKTFTTAALTNLGTLNGHTVKADAGGKIISWTANPALAFDSVVYLAWDYMLNKVPNDPSTGKPAYFSRSYINPSTQAMVDWPHNPAGLYHMLAESAQKYYLYSGNSAVMQLAENVALWHLDHGMTLSTDKWALVPYSSGDPGSLTYGGSYWGNSNGTGDGTGYLQPDKIGELGFAWLQLYKYDGNVRFRDAAIQSANILSSNIRSGNVSQSPWPFRVNAKTGVVKEDYCANVIGPIMLFDALIASGLVNTAAYQTARNMAWSWLMTYPMTNNAWAQYFEDVPTQTAYNTNLNQYDAMMTARYLLEHPEMDPNWEVHVRGLISWVETIFGEASFGATSIREQTPVFAYAMGSHTSRYASVNALLYEKTGDLTAREKAYRSFNWATYMAGSNGVNIDGPSVNNEWFTDSYGDFVRHFMTGMAAVPDWAPFSQTHLLRSGSVVKSITYGSGILSYATYDGSGNDVLHMNFTPLSVTADGVALLQRTDLSQAGWTLDVATKTMKIYHPGATQIVISSTPAAPLAKITSIMNNSRYTIGTDSLITLSAKVTDREHPDCLLKYQWEKELIRNGIKLSIPIDTSHQSRAYLSGIGCDGSDGHWLIRLTVTDPDGMSSSDSVTIYLDCPTDKASPGINGSSMNELKIAPNPVRGPISLIYRSAHDRPVSIQVTELDGRPVAMVGANVRRGQNTIVLQELPILKSGMYIVSVRQGNDVKRGKVIVMQ